MPFFIDGYVRVYCISVSGTDNVRA